MRRNKKGVFTLYDTVLFFVFLLIASSVISAYSAYPRDTDDGRIRFSDYCHGSRQALLGATLRETSYTDLDGNEVIRRDVTVRMLILEQLYLESIGIPRKNFSYPEDISDLANRHLGDSWMLRASMEGLPDLVIDRRGLVDGISDSRSNLTGSVTSSTWQDEGYEGRVEITLYLYR